MIAIEDVYSADGASSVEKWAHIILAKEWGMSMRTVNKWFAESLAPILERGNQFE